MGFNLSGSTKDIIDHKFDGLVNQLRELTDEMLSELSEQYEIG